MAAITRVVHVTFRPEHRSQETIEAVAEEARRVFPHIPGVVSFQAGTPTDDPAPPDLLLVVGFDSLEDVAAYREHDLHVGFVASQLRPRMASLQAINWRTG